VLGIKGWVPQSWRSDSQIMPHCRPVASCHNDCIKHNYCFCLLGNKSQGNTLIMTLVACIISPTTILKLKLRWHVWVNLLETNNLLLKCACILLKLDYNMYFRTSASNILYSGKYLLVKKGQQGPKEALEQPERLFAKSLPCRNIKHSPLEKHWTHMLNQISCIIRTVCQHSNKWMRRRS